MADNSYVINDKRIFSAFGTIFGIFMIFIGYYMISSAGDFYTIDGIIRNANCTFDLVGTSHTTGKPILQYKYRCTFTADYTIDNKTYDTLIRTDSSVRYSSGQIIKLDVDKTNHKNAELHIDYRNFKGYCAMIIGLLIIGSSVSVLFLKE
jgi:hypothetical protein